MFLVVFTFLRRHVIVMGAMFLALAGSAYAVGGLTAARPKTYYACVTPRFHTLNLTTKSARCPRHERKISFNAEGSRGPAGLAGPAGPTGPAGDKGDAGPAGP